MAARAVLCSDVSDFKTWKLVEKEKPVAPEGKVVVKMTLVPVNPTDLFYPRTFFSHFGPDRFITGSEGVGYVEEVGVNVTKVKKGQRVIPSFLKLFHEDGNGSWQDYVVASEDDLYLLPDSIPDESAAQFIINPWTVYGLVLDQKLSKGDYLLQNAAGSVLARMVIQLAKHWGIKTINVVRRDDIKEELKALGADEIINSSTEDVLERVKQITGGKLADGAIDPVAGTATKVIATCVKDGGKVFVYGVLGAKDNTVTVNIFDLGRVDIKLWTASHVIDEQTPPVLAAKIAELLEEKVLVPLSGKQFKLEDFQEAIEESEKPGRGGKVFLRL